MNINIIFILLFGAALFLLFMRYWESVDKIGASNRWQSVDKVYFWVNIVLRSIGIIIYIVFLNMGMINTGINFFAAFILFMFWGVWVVPRLSRYIRAWLDNTEFFETFKRFSHSLRSK
jgi:hypothetical protein